MKSIHLPRKSQVIFKKHINFNEIGSVKINNQLKNDVDNYFFTGYTNFQSIRFDLFFSITTYISY